MESRTNMVFVSAIVAVATIGGFMFGYDSGVINGTQTGLREAFPLWGLGQTCIQPLPAPQVFPCGQYPVSRA